jgi:hypothetical protein
MITQYIPRFRNLDIEFTTERLSRFVRSMKQTVSLIKAEPDKLMQTRSAFLAGDSCIIGFNRYALGHPFGEVKDAFREASQAYLTVFNLRGTEPTFPVVVLTVDPEKSQADPAFVIGERPLHPPGSKDYSNTNSKEGLRAVFSALIAGDTSLAVQLADRLWDPPNASYIHPDSEVCTPNEQHFAYAVKYLLKGDDEKAKKEIDKLRTRRGKEKWLPGVDQMLRGIVGRDVHLFRTGLDDVLFWHEREALKPKNNWDSDWFLCLYGFGLTLLAFQRKLVGIEQLPRDNVYLPVSEWIKS